MRGTAVVGVGRVAISGLAWRNNWPAVCLWMLGCFGFAAFMLGVKYDLYVLVYGGLLIGVMCTLSAITITMEGGRKS